MIDDGDDTNGNIDGTVVCWGWRIKQGACAVYWYAPFQIPGRNNAVRVDMGISKVCAVKKNGTAQCWGNAAGMGDGLYRPSSADNSLVTVRNSDNSENLQGALDIFNAYYATCAHLDTNQMQCWGSARNPVMATNYNYLIFRDLPKCRHYSIIGVAGSALRGGTEDDFDNELEEFGGAWWVVGALSGLVGAGATWLVAFGSKVPFAAVAWGVPPSILIGKPAFVAGIRLCIVPSARTLDTQHYSPSQEVEARPIGIRLLLQPQPLL